MTTPPDSSLIVRNLATWRHVLCCSHSYIEAHGRVQRLEELCDHNCVRHLNYPFDEWRFVDRKGSPASVRVSGNLITNSGEALRKAALQGAGISLAAGFLVSEDLEAGHLVRLLPEYRCGPVPTTRHEHGRYRMVLGTCQRAFGDVLPGRRKKPGQLHRL